MTIQSGIRLDIIRKTLRIQRILIRNLYESFVHSWKELGNWHWTNIILITFSEMTFFHYSACSFFCLFRSLTPDSLLRIWCLSKLRAASPESVAGKTLLDVWAHRYRGTWEFFNLCQGLLLVIADGHLILTLFINVFIAPGSSMRLLVFSVIFRARQAVDTALVSVSSTMVISLAVLPLAWLIVTISVLHRTKRRSESVSAWLWLWLLCWRWQEMSSASAPGSWHSTPAPLWFWPLETHY